MVDDVMYRYAQVYNQIRENVEQADSAADLKWWSVNRGPDMKTSWPAYEVCRMFASVCDHRVAAEYYCY